MTPLECRPCRPCRPSRLKIAGLLVLTCVMVAVSWFCTTLDRVVPGIVGWIGVALFGLCFIGWLRAWLRAGTPTIIVGPDGIEDRQSGYGFIPWQDVTDLTVHSVFGTKLLSVHVADTDAYLARVSAKRRLVAAANRSLGVAPITLGFVDLSPGIDEVLNYIQQLGYGPSARDMSDTKVMAMLGGFGGVGLAVGKGIGESIDGSLGGSIGSGVGFAVGALLAYAILRLRKSS